MARTNLVAILAGIVAAIAAAVWAVYAPTLLPGGEVAIVAEYAAVGVLAVIVVVAVEANS